MSKTKSSFITALGNSQVKDRETAPVEHESSKSAEPDNKHQAAKEAVKVRSHDGRQPASKAKARKGVGRPTSFSAGEVEVKCNFRLSELDAEALRLYITTIAPERDKSEAVRKALRSYIPKEIYDNAGRMLEIKHSVNK